MAMVVGLKYRCPILTEVRCRLTAVTERPTMGCTLFGRSDRKAVGIAFQTDSNVASSCSMRTSPVAQLDRASVFGTEGWGFNPSGVLAVQGVATTDRACRWAYVVRHVPGLSTAMLTWPK